MAKRKIDPEALRSYLDAGHTQADAARHFGVSEPAIHQRLKKIRQLTSHVIALEKAGTLVEQKLTAVERLDRVQRVIDRELDVAVRKAEEPGADRAALAEVILKLAGEIRQQLGLQLQVTRTLIDLRELRDFQRTVVEVIAEEVPEVGRRLVARLKERRALRSSADLPTLDGVAHMASSRDPLDELIQDLEQSLPAEVQVSKYQILPRLEDLQAVMTALLFSSKEDQARIFADPQFQHLYDTVICQMQRAAGKEPDDRPPHLDLAPQDLLDFI
jgi:hypothetical protein